MQSFPELGHKVRVSSSGASVVWWTKDGRQLVFTNAEHPGLWRVDVKAGATFSAGEPKQIATLPAELEGLDAMPDRQRFLALIPEHKGVGSITIVENWQAALDKKK